jgi:hypothetical protein
MFTILSLLDDRARPKGSRDPLGAEACWSQLGRRLVGNLTTVTSNLDNFIVALLCCRFAHQEQTGTAEAQARYLRAEQVAAYLKLAANSTAGFLGVTRAKKNFTGNRPIVLGSSSEAQLLASQAGYGLWGLYSSALEAVGLIAGEHRKLTSLGVELAGTIAAQLGAAGWDEFSRLASATALDRTRTAGLAPRFALTLANPALRSTIVGALLASQRDCALQAELFPLAQAYLAKHSAEWSARKFCAWTIANDGASDALKTVMRRIDSLDPLLKLAEVVWLWLQLKDEKYLTGLQLDDAWQAEANLPHRAFLVKLHASILRADADAAIRALVSQNTKLMRSRGGAPWIEIDGQQKLTVRVRNDRPQNLGALRNATGWHFNYFLYSFLSITNQGRA